MRACPSSENAIVLADGKGATWVILMALYVAIVNKSQATGEVLVSRSDAEQFRRRYYVSIRQLDQITLLLNTSAKARDQDHLLKLFCYLQMGWDLSGNKAFLVT